jgi:glutathione S-transferase
MLVDGFQRVIALLFKVMKIKDAEAFNEIQRVLENYEKLLTDDYFGGKQANIIDYMIWPWFERFRSLKTIINNELDKNKLPLLCKWVSRMIGSNTAVKKTHTIRNHMIEFYKVSLTNQEPDYDFGLEEEAITNAVDEIDADE